MKQNRLIFSKNDVLLYSSCITCTWKEDKKILEIHIGKDAHNIPYATTNLQKDYSNFESIAFCVWAKYPDCKVILRYESLTWYNDKLNVFPLDYDKYDECLEWISQEKKKRKLNDSINSRMQHYMRFLYRVMKMTAFYDEKFMVDDCNCSELKVFTDNFTEYLDNNLFTITEPAQSDNVKKTLKVTENHLEKCFAHYSGKNEMKKLCPEFVNSSSGNIKLYAQLPCGLFVNTKSEKTRIFNRGAFDLWGSDKDKNVCLYELKTCNNKHLGIISELFFYACLISDFHKIDLKKIDSQKNVSTDDKANRGFTEFVQTKEKVFAYFLVPEFHSFIGNNLSAILREMNLGNGNIKYDVIKFNQSSIIGNDEKKFIEKMNQLLNRDK